MERLREPSDDADLPGWGPIMVTHHDALGNYVYASQEAADVTGRPAEELMSNPAAELVHPKDLRVVADAYEAAWERGGPVYLVVRSVDREGWSRWTSTRFWLDRRDPARFTARTRRIDPPPDEKAWFRDHSDRPAGDAQQTP